MTDPQVSLVVACYEMRRELPRTLRSLSPPYQRGCTRENTEIIVVDNGSRRPPRSQDFADLEANIRILPCDAPSVSPVRALNQGLAAARGNLIGAWIDGARLASPGLVSACLAAMTLHPRPVLAPINYQLGPALQYLSSQHGYDQAEEDRLLAAIEWPEHGERLFDIATCELRRGVRGPMLESNALFLPRALWEELGGFDEAFVEPGGGCANPDAFIRACALPGAQLVRILGEGTFHQVHGGVSTSTIDRALETVQQGSRAYFLHRGKPLMPVRDLGWLFDAHRGGLVH